MVVASTQGKQPRRAATEVFNRWGVGHRQRNDGSLFLLAKSDRKAEIVLGDGIDTPVNRRQAQAIMDNSMVPRFRQGDYDQALLVGSTELLQRIYGMDLSKPAEQAIADAVAPSSAFVAQQDSPQVSGTAAEANAAIATPRINPQESGTTVAAPTAETVSTRMLALGLSILAGILGGIYWLVTRSVRMLWWFSGGRLMARRCGACSTRMDLLSEIADDAYLESGELTEERLNSVDYRIWVCPRCRRVDKLARRAWFCRYSNCSTCQSRAVSRISKTINKPTRHSTGMVEITETCQNCHKVRREQRELPVLPPPSDNDSSSSSFDSGSSYDGGSSSGGGASGSW